MGRAGPWRALLHTYSRVSKLLEWLSHPPHTLPPVRQSVCPSHHHFPRGERKRGSRSLLRTCPRSWTHHFHSITLSLLGHPRAVQNPREGVVIPKDGRGYFSSIKDLLTLGDRNSFCHARFSGKTRVSFRKPKSSSTL